MFSDVHKQRPRDDDFFCDTPLCSNQSTFNDGSYTCLHPVLGTTTAIDLSLCSPNIRIEIDFLVESESYSSDHCFKNLCIAS